jgi:hypothetical protein
VNCFRVVNNYCQSPLANGERWETNFNIAVACPKEFPFGTVIILEDGSKWECKDRGGKIVFIDNIPYIDFLVRAPQFTFGSILEVTIIYP